MQHIVFYLFILVFFSQSVETPDIQFNFLCNTKNCMKPEW